VKRIRPLLGRGALARRTLGFLRPYRGLATLAAICTVLQALLNLVPVLVFRALVDELTKHHPRFSAVAGFLGLGLAAVIASGLIYVAASYLVAQISENIIYDLRQQLLERFLEQSLGYFTRRRSGEILSHLLNDVDAIDTVLTDSLLTVIRSAVMLIAMIALMFVLAWQLAVLTLLVVPLIFLPLRLSGRANYLASLGVQDHLSEMTVYLQETLGLSGVMLVKAFARGATEHARFAELNGELRRRRVRAAMATRWFMMVLQMLQVLGPMILLLVGGLLITKGSSSLGTVLAFSTIIVGQFSGTVQGLGSAVVVTAGSLAVWERIFSVLDLRPELTDRPDAVGATDISGSIRFEHVSFTYPDAPSPALRDITLEMEPGQLTALVGPSGAGKTTFSALIARFMDPSTGAVTLDGIDLRDLSLSSLQQAVGIVFQDAFLFHTTLRENLRYGRPTASDEEIWQAAREANLEVVIESMPHGLDTLVGERGHRLSGGEKQRVAIARVLLKDPRILLLDEATAHLDNVSERLVQAALERLFVGRTSLVIAHRLSTVMSADAILVLERGRIVERGRHEELLAAGGVYSDLHSSQLVESDSPRIL
jgi:ATP-binding cassette subfamily B protein